MLKRRIDNHGYFLSGHLHKEIEHTDFHVRLVDAQRVDKSLAFGEHRQARRAVGKSPELESDRLGLALGHGFVRACRHINECDGFVFWTRCLILT